MYRIHHIFTSHLHLFILYTVILFITHVSTCSLAADVIIQDIAASHSDGASSSSSSNSNTNSGGGGGTGHAGKTNNHQEAVIICGIDGTVYTLDAWTGHLRGMFHSGPPIVRSSNDNNDSNNHDTHGDYHSSNNHMSNDRLCLGLLLTRAIHPLSKSAWI